jgi:hypothetical protein
MNRLTGHTAYLAGPIDKSEDFGRGWRESISKFLWGLGVGVFNPCDKPIDNQYIDEDDGFVGGMNRLKTDGHFDKLSKGMQEVVRLDLKMVDLSNFIILHVDPSVHMCGSYTEMTYGCLQRKPIIVHCPIGKSKVPNWMFGLCDHNIMFSSWPQVKQYINSVAHGQVDDIDGKWRFINYKKVFGGYDVT